VVRCTEMIHWLARSLFMSDLHFSLAKNLWLLAGFGSDLGNDGERVAGSLQRTGNILEAESVQRNFNLHDDRLVLLVDDGAVFSFMMQTQQYYFPLLVVEVVVPVSALKMSTVRSRSNGPAQYRSKRAID
jgi:hypothetical protein